MKRYGEWRFLARMTLLVSHLTCNSFPRGRWHSGRKSLMDIIAQCIRHPFQHKADRQIRIVQDKGLTEVEGAIYLARLEGQNKIDRTLQYFFQLHLLDGRIG